jgi:hypothetical protein
MSDNVVFWISAGMTVCKIQQLQKKVLGLFGSWTLSLFSNSKCKYTTSEISTINMYVRLSITNISCYDIMSIFHSLMQLNIPKMCHKTVGNLRFRPIKRWDFNHVMWSSLPCILNIRLCRPARRNIVTFFFFSSVHRKITWILMSVFHTKYIYFTEKMCKILILVPLVIKSVSLNAKLNLCASYCIAISIQYGIN